MRNLRRALLRGAICGLVFSIVAWAVLSSSGKVRLVWADVSAFLALTFVTGLFVSIVAGIELRALAAPPSIRRDALVLALSFLLGVSGVALGALQFAYLTSSLQGKGILAALDECARMLRELQRDDDARSLCIAFALPVPCVALARVRRVPAPVACIVAVLVTLGLGLPVTRHAGDATIIGALLAGAALALDLGTRVAELLADRIERWLDPEAERPVEERSLEEAP